MCHVVNTCVTVEEHSQSAYDLLFYSSCPVSIDTMNCDEVFIGHRWCTYSCTCRVFSVSMHCLFLAPAAPVMVEPPVTQNVSEGSTVTFTCRARAIPDADVTWYLNGFPIKGNL